jgi:phytoene dehydrogenase-like protein
VAESYDVAIIGAGPEGLIAAQTLASANLKVLVLEKAAIAGGRAATREFHPGFRASPYADELPAIPDFLFRRLNPARHRAVLVPTATSLCVSEEGVSALFADAARMGRGWPSGSAAALRALRTELATLSDAIEKRALQPSRRLSAFERRRVNPWPGEDWGLSSLDAALNERISDSKLCVHLAADALSGRAASPFLAGSALHLLAPGTGRSGVAAGGLGALGNALAQAAHLAGATIRCETEVSDIRIAKSFFGGTRATGLVLGSGEEVAASVILSALDLGKTLLGLIAWSSLPKAMVKRAGQYRSHPQKARVLIALDAPPVFALSEATSEMMRGPIHLLQNVTALSRAQDAWRTATLDPAPHITFRLPSAVDPLLAPIGKAVLTATVSCVPGQLFDGGWTAEKRAALASQVIEAAETVFPGLSARIVAHETLVGPDFEAALGSSRGDLDGGELAPDQALSHRPFAGWDDGRTSVRGLYLAGPSSAVSPFFTGLSGYRAAQSIVADLQKGKAP